MACGLSDQFIMLGVETYMQKLRYLEEGGLNVFS